MRIYLTGLLRILIVKPHKLSEQPVELRNYPSGYFYYMAYDRWSMTDSNLFLAKNSLKRKN